jgi:CelD/BcsL family acetyltransferase involved in cellulose biosynthesis
VKVITIDPGTHPHWRTLLEQREAGLFHSPPWLGVLSDTYGLRPQAYVVLDAADAPIAGLAYCEMADMLGRRFVALPFTDACDPLGRSAEGWQALCSHLAAREAPVNLRFLNFVLPVDNSEFRVAKLARWHSLDVADPSEALWMRLAGATRRAILKAERLGVLVRALSGSGELRLFHGLHVALRKQKYRLLAQPFAFFAAIARRFEEAGGWFPLGAFVEGRLVAAAIFLRWRDTLYYKFNASASAALDLRPNNLLIWRGIELAKSLGCRRLDLGPSDDDQPGLVRFKRNFGAEESELRHLRYVPAGWHDDRARRTRLLLGDLTALLTGPRVPDDAAGEAGTLLYRYFA